MKNTYCYRVIGYAWIDADSEEEAAKLARNSIDNHEVELDLELATCWPADDEFPLEDDYNDTEGENEYEE